jgi:threonine dehydrogenase-like Zn-dependent dehydrogenase
MKIAVLHGPRDLRIEEHDLDRTLGPHQVHVETEICTFKIGTDRGNYEGAEAVPGVPDFPRGVGDSNLGIVRAVGSQVTHLQPGDRVVSRAPHQSEYVADPRLNMVRVPKSVDSEDAVWAHLYMLSAHCYRKAFFTPGENVAVVGLGVLGLGAVALGPHFGARVIGLGNHPARLDMATSMGADAVFLSDDVDLTEKLDAFTDGAGVDLVILTANRGRRGAPPARWCGPTGASPSSPCRGAAKRPSILIPCPWSGSTTKGLR